MRTVVTFVGAVLALAVLAGAGMNRAAEDKKEKKYTIPEVMKLAHKGKPNLMTKVAEGKGSKRDKELLLGLYIALSESKPPKGSEADWKKRTEAIVKAARGVVEGKEGAQVALKKAVNCGGCHKLHKPED